MHCIFNRFPTLPPELRLRIWHLAMQRQRIIKLRLHSRMIMDGLLGLRGDTRPQTREDERYGAVVEGYQTLSKLFRVSRESRDAALAFYRVHLPCWLIKGATTRTADVMKSGMLYFNPEYDFLYTSSSEMGQVADILHDLKTLHDPHHVGLLNLAVDSNGLTGSGSLCGTNPFMLDPLVKSSVVETLTQLHEVFFVQEQRTGRHVLGLRSGSRTSEIFMNRSFPITTTALNFDRLHRDPRRIGDDLGKVFVNVEPRKMLYAWRQLLNTYLCDRVVPQTEHRVLLTFTPFVDIYDHQDAENWLQKEDDMWVEETSKGGQSQKVLGEDSGTEVAAAFGFWLFPIQIFGALPENLDDGFTNESPRIMNFREHWPELGLVDLL